MTGEQLRLGRKNKGWTQQEAGAKLGVSQPYLALMEQGARRVPAPLARKAASLYGLSPAVLAVEADASTSLPANAQQLAKDLGRLGYPGFAYLKANRSKNPAEVLFAALSFDNLDSRLTEALPWVLVHYPDLDWNWLVSAAKNHDLQNRLGFVTSLARKLAEREGNPNWSLLAAYESVLERGRLAREDTLCHDSLSEAEKRWVREKRSEEARHWNLLTDLSPEHLSYAV